MPAHASLTGAEFGSLHLLHCCQSRFAVPLPFAPSLASRMFTNPFFSLRDDGISQVVPIIRHCLSHD